MPMWKMRCEVQHGKNSGARAQVMEKLGERMNWYMAHKHELLTYHDRRLAKHSMGEIHQLNRRQRAQWIKYLDIARDAHTKEKRAKGRGQPLITKYLVRECESGEEPD